MLDRFERDRLQRYRSAARLRLRAFQPALCERAVDVDDPRRLQVAVPPFEREPFGGTEPGGGREDHHRPMARREIRDDGMEFGPRLERALLPAPWKRVVDAELGRVDIDHSPDDRPGEHLPKRLGGVEPVAR